MKVLHLLYNNRFSGAENVVCQIFAMFKDAPDVEMVYCSSDGPISEMLKERNIRFVPLSEFSVKSIKRVIKVEKPDVIHAHDMRASFYASCACGKIKLISHIHNNAFDSRGISVKSIAYLFAAKKAKHIFWVSQSSFNGYKFHKLFKKKSTVLYNIIDMNALYEKMQRDTNEYDYDVVYVGRLTYPKNPERLIEVLKKVCDNRPETKIAIIGSGDLEEKVKMLCSEKNLNGNVSFLGFLSNPYKIMRDARVMLMTSRWEGTPMCALEALALGLPVVSTPTDGLKEIIISDVNGYLANDDDFLAEKTVSVLKDAQLRERLSRESYDKAIKHNIVEKYRAEILKAYRL
jgi:glycosyltransferase involved in cell wall biosynthesis